jgi:hypothetical protein
VPKPLEEKRRTGNPGNRHLPDPSQVAYLPAAPLGDPPSPMRPLEAAGLALWGRVWAAGAVWLAAGVDAESLLVLCEQIDERELLRAKVLAEGNWRDRSSLRALDQQVMTGLALLGFNPVDRARLGAAEVRNQSELEKFLGRRQVQ